MSANAPPATPPEPCEARARVYLAEDSDELRLLFHDALVAAGYEVVDAPTGPRLLRLLQTRTPNGLPELVISDVRMPGMSGLQVLALLRAEHRVPFIFMTAFADNQVEEVARRLGSPRVLSKPLLPRDLLAAVDEALMTSRGGAARAIPAR